MRRKSAGNTTDIAWREIRTTCSSVGWRNASSACGGNSPSSSRNNTPRCARVTPMLLGLVGLIVGAIVVGIVTALREQMAWTRSQRREDYTEFLNAWSGVTAAIDEF